MLEWLFADSGASNLAMWGFVALSIAGAALARWAAHDSRKILRDAIEARNEARDFYMSSLEKMAEFDGEGDQ